MIAATLAAASGRAIRRQAEAAFPSSSGLDNHLETALAPLAEPGAQTPTP